MMIRTVKDRHRLPTSTAYIAPISGPYGNQLKRNIPPAPSLRLTGHLAKALFISTFLCRFLSNETLLVYYTPHRIHKADLGERLT
jgi:hypothetical protein